MTPYEFELDLTPGSRRRACITCSQGDVGRPFAAHLKYQGADYVVPEGSSIEIHALKPDGNIYEKLCTWTTHYAYFETELQLSPIAGDVECELSITGDSNTPLGTANFTIHVEKSPIESGVESESEIGWVKEAQAAATESESWAVGGTGTRTGEDTDNAKYYNSQTATAVSTETTRATAAETLLSSQIKALGDENVEKAFSNWCALNRNGKVYSTKFYYFSTNSTSAGIKMDANANLTAAPSTDTVEGTDDYADIPVFEWFHCNYVRESDGFAKPTTLEGNTDYKNTGNVDVGSLNMTFYWAVEDHKADGYYIIHISDTPHPELNLVPWVDAVRQDGTVMPYFIVSAYSSVVAPDGYLRSIHGQPAYNQSYTSMITDYAKKGTGYHGAGASRNTLAYIFLAIKYGTKNSQTVMSGVSSYSTQSVVALAETGVTRVLLAAQGQFVVGGTVSVGDLGTNTSKDRGNAYMSNIADRVRVKSIETVTVDSTSYVAINLDITDAITTTVTTYISTMASYSGWTDDVIGHKDGSPISNTDGAHPCRIKGIECFNGLYRAASDTVLAMQSDYNHKVYTCNRWDTRLTTGIEASYKLIGTLPGASTSGAEFWTGDIGLDTGTGSWYPETVGTSSSLGTGDACYGTSATSWYREYIQCGILTFGVNDGCTFLHCGNTYLAYGWNTASCD